MARQQEELKDRLDAFVRKYHRNEMLRGGLILAACVPVAWLVVLGLEAMGRFGMTARTALFYLFVTVVSAVAIRYLLLPAMRLVRLRSGLDHAEAARIIGRHFPDIEDRLLFRPVLETLRCLEEGVLRSVADANIGSILGIGAPVWTGGYLQFVNTYGLPAFVERCEAPVELVRQRRELQGIAAFLPSRNAPRRRGSRP